jgi:hypothetical protein
MTAIIKKSGQSIFQSQLELSLFIFLFLAYAFFFNEYPGWNGNTRMDLIYAIVEEGKLNIDDYWNQEKYFTNDVAVLNGHYYCDKSPILSFLGVPVYWIWTQLTSMAAGHISPVMGRYPVIVFVVSLSSAYLSVLLFRFLGYLRANPVDQLIVTLFYALGTPAFPYSILFQSHQVTAFFIFMSFYLIYRYLHFSYSNVLLFVAGLSAGFGFAAEQPSGIIMACILGWLFFRMPRKTAFIWLLIGCLFPVCLNMFYNYKCFGSPFITGYRYELLEEFRTEMSKGVMGITYPKLDAIWGMTFSSFRGLFYYSPVLLGGLFGIYYLIRDQKNKHLGYLFLLIVLGYFYFNTSFFLWFGGWSYGPRHFIPAIPFLAAPLYWVFPKQRTLLIVLGVISIILASLACITDPQYPDTFQNPLVEFVLSCLSQGFWARSILSMLGVPRVMSIIIWAFYIFIGTFCLYKFALAHQSAQAERV